MPCLLLILVLAFPRVILAAMFLFSTYLERAYHGLIVPILGFLFLPLTTIVYAWMMNSHLPLEGVNVLYPHRGRAHRRGRTGRRRVAPPFALLSADLP